MRAKRSIKLPIDESPYVTTKLVNPTIDTVIANESPFVVIEVDNHTTNRFVLKNHHLLPLRLIITPQIGLC
jgi:hypothetical protein